MEMKISIIIPVYNVEKYISECIDSVINQTYDKIEIILIDDGSTDDSGKICDDYSKKDNRVKVIHKSNGGVSSARNAGIECSTGDIIFFMDSDDYVKRDMIEKSLNLIANNDMLVFGYFETYVNGKIKKNISNDNINIEKEQLINGVLNNNYIKGFLWNKVFRKDIIINNNIRFIENVGFLEDMYFVMQYISCCNKFLVSKENLYYYRMRKSSSVRQVNEKKKNDFILVYTKLSKWLYNSDLYLYNLYTFYLKNKMKDDIKKHNLSLIKLLKSKKISTKNKIKLIINYINPNFLIKILNTKKQTYQLFD